MRIVTFCLAFLIFNEAPAQSIPSIMKVEGRKMYSGMYNEFVVNLNGADPAHIELKCSNSHINTINDTTFQIYPRAVEEEEIKVKLYYKKLPVDIFTLQKAASPTIGIRSDDIVDNVVSLDKLLSTELIFSFNDPYLDKEGYRVYSYRFNVVPQTREANPPVLVLRQPNFAALSSIIHRIKKGDRVVLQDFKLINQRHQVINSTTEPFEFMVR